MAQHDNNSRLDPEGIQIRRARYKRVENEKESEKYKRLRAKAQNHTITRAELDDVVAELQDPDHETDPLTLLPILAALETEMTLPYLLPMAAFFKGPDWWAAREALCYVCLRYTYSSPYMKEILHLMKGVPWDWNDEVRTMAITVAAAHCERQMDAELFRELINIAEHEEHPQVRN